MDKDYRRQFDSIQQPPVPPLKVGTVGYHQALTMKGSYPFLNKETFPKTLNFCLPDYYYKEF
jgi:hypothetical protein